MARRKTSYQPQAFADNPLILSRQPEHWSWLREHVVRRNLSPQDRARKLLDRLIAVGKTVRA